MATKKVSVLKFVGTVSLGLLTGLSYSLSSITLPAILSLPSAAAASNALQSVTRPATLQLNILTSLAASTFSLAFFLSPRSQRHPYLLYTSALAFAIRFAPDLAPYILGRPVPAAPRRAPTPKQNAPRPMEQSYEVLGDVHSEGTGSASGGEDPFEDEQWNGEEIRVTAETYQKAKLVETGLSALSFALAIVGIWGDGVAVSPRRF